jgi:hypothetical protein
MIPINPRIQDPDVEKYARLWIHSHAEEVRAALEDAGIETAVIIPPGLQNRQPSAFGFCAKLLIGTELSYRAVWSTAKRAGWPHLTINAVRNYASRLRCWYGVPVPQRMGRTGLRWKK